MVVEPELVEQLRQVDLFAGLEPAQLARAADSAVMETVEPDGILFHQGMAAERFYWLRSGLVKLVRLAPSGEEKVIELVQPGQCFAEALMFSGRRVAYPVSAHGLERSEVVGFDNRVFLELLRDSPDSCLRLLANMSRRLHALVNDIDRLTLQSATHRLVDFLLTNARDGVVELRTPKHVLASRLSIKPETLSRIFARLAGEGLIRVQGAQIDLLRPAELRARLDAAEP